MHFIVYHFTTFNMPYMTGFISPLLMSSWSKFPSEKSLYGKILGLVGFRSENCHQVIQPIQCTLMIFQLNQDLQFFNWSKFRGYTCNIYISYVKLRNLCFAGSLLIMIRQNSGLNASNEFGNKQNSTFNNAASIIVQCLF